MPFRDMSDSDSHNFGGRKNVDQLTFESDLPDVGCIIPEIVFSRVVFPAPLAPTMATISPLSIFRDRLCKTSTSP